MLPTTTRGETIDISSEDEADHTQLGWYDNAATSTSDSKFPTNGSEQNEQEEQSIEVFDPEANAVAEVEKSLTDKYAPQPWERKETPTLDTITGLDTIKTDSFEPGVRSPLHASAPGCGGGSTHPANDAGQHLPP